MEGPSLPRRTIGGASEPPWFAVGRFDGERVFVDKHKTLTARIKSDGNFQGGVIFYVMTRWSDWTHYDWKGLGWATPGADWMTLSFDLDQVKAQDPDFNPTIIAEMGILVQNTNASPTPTTLWVDTIQYPL